ncbi:MAG: hypothetical protein HOE90_19960 [Bacteriovoracaceae bacterium]|nr:hypothetical protein [Bacteriovoracaceae bacterium]
MGQLSSTDRKCDPSLPGENWFFYWKTSYSLWENKISSYDRNVPLFVPINWGFHLNEEGGFDFGEKRPETDLKKIYFLAKEMGKEVCFLVPLGPCPFLVNGGIAPALASSLACASNGLVYSVIDSDGSILKLYSFFDTKLYKVFRSFVWSLGQYLSSNGVDADIIGMESGYLESGEYQDYFSDSSRSFMKGFSKFLGLKIDEKRKQFGDVAITPDVENQYKNQYKKMIKDLYHNSAKECLNSSWVGVLKFAFLGARPYDIFLRSSERKEDVGRYFKEVTESITLGVSPTSVLLDGKIKNGVLNKAFEHLLSKSFFYQNLNGELFDDFTPTTFFPLWLFELFRNETGLKEGLCWKNNGLANFLSCSYHGTYILKDLQELDIDECIGHKKIYFFHGLGMSRKSFEKVLRIFLNGERVVFDTDSLDPSLIKRLNAFIIENDIDTQEVKLISSLVLCKLGEGSLVYFDGNELSNSASGKKDAFWNKLLNYADLSHLKIEHDKDINFLWLRRSPSNIELTYEEVRRVSFFNPSSYKRKAKVVGSKNFAFLKISEKENASVKSTPIGVDLELLPGGSVSLDFGHFE